VLAARAAKEYNPEIRQFLLSAEHRPRCKIDPWPDTATDILIFAFGETPFGTVTYEITPRSVSGVFQFLANTLATHQEGTFRMRGRLSPVEDTRILAVERETFWQHMLSTVDRHCAFTGAFSGEYYCVPQDGAENTKRIFDLLAYLMGMNS
jgi:hypothetical protein